MASVFVLLEAFNRKEAAALGFFPCATASFSIPKILSGLFGFDGIEREFMGLSWSNYWWTIGANHLLEYSLALY